MRYALITKSGKVMMFYIKDMAEMYQRTHGGVVLDEETSSPKVPVVPVQKKPVDIKS